MERLSPADEARLLGPLAPIGAGGWIVGGCVRDVLLGRPVVDIDVAYTGDVRAAARALARAHGAGRFELSQDFGGWRVHGGSLPCTVDLIPLVGSSLEDDLSRRDLTVNAMAIPLAGGALVDPHAGRADIAARRLRAVSATALAADPVRVLRLIRQAHQLGFAIDPATRDLARSAAGGLGAVAPERVRAELVAILTGPRPPAALGELVRDGLLDGLLPELGAMRGMAQGAGHHLDVEGHVLLVVEEVDAILADLGAVFGDEAPDVAERLGRPLGDGLDRGRAILLAALLHDIGKPATSREVDGAVAFAGHAAAGAAIARAWCDRMRFAGRVAEFVERLVRVHGDVAALTVAGLPDARAVHRHFVATAPVEIEALVHYVADRSAARGHADPGAVRARALAVAARLATEHRVMSARTAVALLSGDEIAGAAGRPPGRWLGEAVAALREAQAIGAVSDRGGAMDFVRTLQERGANHPDE